ncbi:hypothetical protein X740_16210 [Mesorhizobium sp. LNHC221B00]|nr:hypothetical protein X740_16210 [Mesorhizobium sp. LNHC221B00]
MSGSTSGWRPPGSIAGALDHGSDLIVIDCARTAKARFIQQGVNALLQKAPPPLADGMLMNAELGCHGLAGKAICAPQNDPASFSMDPPHDAGEPDALKIGPSSALNTSGEIGRPVALAIPSLLLQSRVPIMK